MPQSMLTRDNADLHYPHSHVDLHHQLPAAATAQLQAHFLAHRPSFAHARYQTICSTVICVMHTPSRGSEKDR